MPINFDLIQKAANYVRELGNEDGNEHLCALDANGNVLFVCHGNENVVSAEGYDFKDVSYVVHNHPNDSSLSVQDVAMSNHHKCWTVAVSRTGSMYASSGVYPEKLRSHYPDEDEEGLLGYSLGGLNNIDHKAAANLFLASMFVQFNEDEINTLASHMGNLAYSHLGYMNYEFRLSEHDAAMFKRHSKLANKMLPNGISLT